MVRHHHPVFHELRNRALQAVSAARISRKHHYRTARRMAGACVAAAAVTVGCLLLLQLTIACGFAALCVATAVGAWRHDQLFHQVTIEDETYHQAVLQTHTNLLAELCDVIDTAGLTAADRTCEHTDVAARLRHQLQPAAH